MTTEQFYALKREKQKPVIGNCGICGVEYNQRAGWHIKGKMVCIDCADKELKPSKGQHL